MADRLGNRLDDCGVCTLVPTESGRWVSDKQATCPVHGTWPYAPRSAPSAPSQALPADQDPAEAPERQPAYDAVYTVIRRYPTSGLAGAMENARVWRAVEAALDAMEPVWRAAGRTAAAADIDAERVKRAQTACCQANGYCGIGDCNTDSTWHVALSDAARIAEGEDRG